MLKELSIKKILCIAVSIGWIDFIASQKCINYQCCPDNCKAFLLYGIAPVAAIWIIYCAFYHFKKEKEKHEKTGKPTYLDHTGRDLK